MEGIMACSSGCKAQDHESYGACLKANMPSVKNGSQSKDRLYRLEKLNAQEITEYRAARAQGIQPKGTKLSHIRAAVAESRAKDTAVTHY